MHRLKRLLHYPSGLIGLSLLVGIVNAVLLMGWSLINPTNVSWLTRDNATHHLGWAFYRYERGWSFPLSWTDRIGYPVGTSTAFLDSVPLVGVLLRPLERLLPEPFQYLGLYAVLCFVLQAYFGFRISRRLSSGDPVFTILGGFFFLFSPPLTWQLFGHYPHLGHWLILACIDGYLRETTTMPPLRWIAPLWGVLALAGGINPYLAATCFLIVLAGIGRLLLERRCGWQTATLLAAVTPAVLFGSLLAIGFLMSQDPSAYRAPGYGTFSLNLLGPINPMVFGSLVFPGLPITNGGQFEGYNYLGAGVVALLVLGVVRGLKPLLWPFDRKLLPLLCLALVCTAAAVSSTVSFGSTILLQFELPKPLASIAEGLRVSGRLFWPAHYLLIASAISLTFWRWKPPYRGAILAAALALHAADLHTLRRNVRAAAEEIFESPLRSPVWRQIGRDSDNLVVLPAYQCGPDAAPGGRTSYQIFGMLAAAQQMRTNSFYAARYTTEEMYVHCRDIPRDVLSGKLDPRTAYVVTDGIRAVLDMSPKTSHRCEVVDGFNLCTTANAENPAAIRFKPKPAAYSIGQPLDFTATGNARPHMMYGWAAESGPDGTWTEGPLAKLLLELPNPVNEPLSLVLDAGSRAFLTKYNHRLDADVIVNGQLVDRWTFRYGRPMKEVYASIPEAVTAGSRLLDVELWFHNPHAPAYVNAGTDGRFLGLNVRALVLQPAR